MVRTAASDLGACRFAAAHPVRVGIAVLVAFVLVLFPSVPSANAAPTLQIVVANPSYATLAVDGSGVAYGTRTGSTTEVWRSLDEGRTWDHRSTFPTGDRLWHLIPLASGTLLAGVDTGSWDIFRSTDQGANWTRVLSLPTTPCALNALTPHNIAEGDGFVFLGTYNHCPDVPNTNYIYRSADDGRSWSIVHTSTTYRHMHGVRFDPSTHTLFALYGDSAAAIERSGDDGVTWTRFCTTYADCRVVDMAFGDGFAIYGTDTPDLQNAIVRIDLATGQTRRLLDLPRVSYSALALGSGRFLVGTTYESGAATGDGKLHLFASDDGGQSFADVYSTPFSGTSAVRLEAQFAFPNGDFPIVVTGGGTIVARFAGGAAVEPPANLTAPAISGTAQLGQTLSASPGTWTGTQPITFAYQWQQCTTGGTGNYAQTVLADNPIGYWRFEETSGSTVTDSSGKGHSGSYLGGVALNQPGAVNGSLAAGFDGSDDEVDITTGASALSPARLTVEAWAKSKTSTWNTYGYIASKRNSYLISPTQGSKSLSFRVWTGSSTVNVLDWTPAASFDISQWHHYAGSFDGTTLRFYVDGSQVATLPASGNAAADTGPLFIGRDDGFTRWGSAYIDEVAVYNSALPANRILAHAQASSGGTGTTCTDINAQTGQTYQPTSTDVGNTLRVRIRATNTAGGPTDAYSPQTATVTS